MPRCLSLVARIEVVDIRERDELLELVRRAPRDGFQHEADMVADVVAAQHRTGEPPGRVVENRQPFRARMPCAPREFVSPIAGLAAEQPDQSAVPPLYHVDRKMARTLGLPVGVIAFRQSHHEPAAGGCSPEWRTRQDSPPT